MAITFYTYCIGITRLKGYKYVVTALQESLQVRGNVYNQVFEVELKILGQTFH